MADDPLVSAAAFEMADYINRSGFPLGSAYTVGEVAQVALQGQQQNYKNDLGVPPVGAATAPVAAAEAYETAVPPPTSIRPGAKGSADVERPD
jgi:hypothetical protein